MDVLVGCFLGYSILFLCFVGRFIYVVFELLVVFLCVVIFRYYCVSSGCFLIGLELVNEFYLFISEVVVLNFLEGEK